MNHRLPPENKLKNVITDTRHLLSRAFVDISRIEAKACPGRVGGGAGGVGDSSEPVEGAHGTREREELVGDKADVYKVCRDIDVAVGEEVGEVGLFTKLNDEQGVVGGGGVAGVGETDLCSGTAPEGVSGLVAIEGSDGRVGVGQIDGIDLQAALGCGGDTDEEDRGGGGVGREARVRVRRNEAHGPGEEVGVEVGGRKRMERKKEGGNCGKLLQRKGRKRASKM